MKWHTTCRKTHIRRGQNKVFSSTENMALLTVLRIHFDISFPLVLKGLGGEKRRGGMNNKNCKLMEEYQLSENYESREEFKCFKIFSN